MAQVREKRLHVYPGNTGTFSGGVTAGWTVLAGASYTSGDPGTPTLDGVNGTLVDSVTAGSTSVKVWVWENIAGGSGAFSFTGAGDLGFTAYAISGAATSSAVEDFGSGGGTGTSLTTNLALSGGGGFYCWYGNEAGDSFTSFTASLVTNGHDAGHVDADGSLEVASGNANVGVNVSSDSNNAFVAVALKNAAGGGGGLVANPLSGRGGAAAQPLVN